MKRNAILAVTSVLTILFTIVHLADDYSRGFSTAGLSSLPVAPVLAMWLYSALMLLERRAGLVVTLVMSLLASGLPVLHMIGKSGITGGAAPASAGAFFFAWTLLAVGATSSFSVIASARALWSLRRQRGTMRLPQGPGA